jgi:hypothetical protein
MQTIPAYSTPVSPMIELRNRQFSQAYADLDRLVKLSASMTEKHQNLAA